MPLDMVLVNNVIYIVFFTVILSVSLLRQNISLKLFKNITQNSSSKDVDNLIVDLQILNKLKEQQQQQKEMI
jgi:hypothetical protein